MHRLWRPLLIATILAVAIFAAFSIYADVSKLGDRLRQFAIAPLVAALGLAMGNYVIRFARWQAYLRTVDVKAPTGTSLLVFLSGFAMSVTPGKLGELVKAVLLRDAVGTAAAPVARVAPVVVAERLSDLLALVVLGVAGVATYGVGAPMVIAAAGVTAFGVLVLSWRRLAHWVISVVARVPKIGKIAPRLLESYDHLGKLVRPAALAWGTALGVVAWLCECMGFAIIVRAFPGAHVALGLAILIYATTTVAGALSFLPGGLLVTEASMTLFLVSSADGLDRPAAVAATILTRICTLWFAVGIGLIALVVLRRWKPATRDAIDEAATVRP